MFRQILFVNWKATRFGMIPFLLVAFGLPILSVQGSRLEGLGSPEGATVRGNELLYLVSQWAHLYPALAFALGAIFALMIWNWDHRGEHVYALSLPLPRWKYVVMKMEAGGILLLLPVFLLWLGALLAVGFTEIPEGLRAYPTAVAFRFLLATLIAYAVFFALASGTMRTAIIILSAWLGLLVLGEFVPPFMGAILDLSAVADFSLLDWFLDSAMSWPGPFEVYSGNWMLIDV
ncbi:hypothetical protein ACFL0I_04030 [Gemmatimonadota bacterium]